MNVSMHVLLVTHQFERAVYPVISSLKKTDHKYKKNKYWLMYYENISQDI